MGGVEDAVFPVLGGDVVIGAFFFVGVVAEGGYEFIFAVEDGDAACEFSDGDVVAVEGDGAGAAEIFGDDGDEIAVEIEVLEAFIFAIADEEEGLFAAGVEGDAVAGLELAWLIAFATEAFDVLLIFIELVDPVLAVAVGDVDIAARCDGDSGGVVLACVFVLAGFHGDAYGPDLGAVEFKFDDAGVVVECAVDELFAIFFAQADSVDADEFFSAYGFDHFAVGAVDEEGVIAGVHAEIDLALFIDDDAAVGGAEVLSARGHLAPVGNTLIGVCAFACEDKLRDGAAIGWRGECVFAGIVCEEDRGGCQSGGEGKPAAQLF